MRRAWAMAGVAGGMLACVAAGGCGSPNAANIELRKRNQELEGLVTALKEAREADRARIAALESRPGATLPALPQERLDRLFTAQGIDLGRFSGSADLDPRQPGDEGLKIYLTPRDQTGGALKATGAVEVDAFDLTGGDEPRRVGRWTFGPAEMIKAWRSLGPLEAFVLECPWQQTPPAKVSYRVTFTDELTGRKFEVIRETEVKGRGD